MNPPKLVINDEDVLIDVKGNERNGYIQGTLSAQMKAIERDARNIRVKIICSNQIILDEDECAFYGIDILKKNEIKKVK